MIWIYRALRATPTKNHLALLIAGLRWIGIFGFALLSGYFVTQDAYLELTISRIELQCSKDHLGSYRFMAFPT